VALAAAKGDRTLVELATKFGATCRLRACMCSAILSPTRLPGVAR
jgi:hypothetical protein